VSEKNATFGEIVQPASLLGRSIAPGLFPFDAFEFDREETSSSPVIRLKGPWRLALTGLPSYASNALALAAGLSIGDLYRLGDYVAVVH
jgi:hypothetical protein